MKLKRILDFSIVRGILLALFLIPLFIGHKIIFLLIPALDVDIFRYIYFPLAIILFVFIYRFYAKLVEKREDPYEVSTKKSLKEWFLGIGIGMGIIIFTGLVVFLLGYLKIIKVNFSFSLFIDISVKVLIFSFVEEVFYRLGLFRLTERYWGSWIALIIGSLLFGLMHISNDFISPLIIIFAILWSGIVGILYIYSKRIWLPFGVHFGWNYAQALFLGGIVSGNSLGGLIVTEIKGPSLLTGGGFGIEASIIAIVLSLIVGFVFLKKDNFKKNILLPKWKR